MTEHCCLIRNGTGFGYRRVLYRRVCFSPTDIDLGRSELKQCIMSQDYLLSFHLSNRVSWLVAETHGTNAQLKRRGDRSAQRHISSLHTERRILRFHSSQQPCPSTGIVADVPTSRRSLTRAMKKQIASRTTKKLNRSRSDRSCIQRAPNDDENSIATLRSPPYSLHNTTFLRNY